MTNDADPLVKARAALAADNSGNVSSTPARKGEVSIEALNEMAFVLEQASKRQATQGPIPGESEGLTAGGSVTHMASETIIMYKPDGHGHYTARRVPAHSVRQSLASGFKISCPDCGGHHGYEPNTCPGRESVSGRICPVCGSKIFDVLNLEAQAAADPDPAMIVDDAYKVSTPATRTKALLDNHIRVRHEVTAEVMGLTRPPETAINPATVALGGSNG